MSASHSITVSTRGNTEKTKLAQNNQHMKKWINKPNKYLSKPTSIREYLIKAIKINS